MQLSLLALTALVLHISATAVDWAHLTNETLAKVDPAEFQKIKASDFVAIPAEACGGFRKEQTAILNREYGCRLFTVPCVVNMKPEAFEGFSYLCFGGFSDTAKFAMTAAQVARISVEVFSTLARPKLQEFNPSACAGFTHDQIQHLNNNYPYSACAGLSPKCIQSMTVDAVSGMASKCLKIMDAESIRVLTDLQVAVILPDAFSGLTDTLVHSLSPSACTAINTEQIAKLVAQYPANACAGFTPECFHMVPAKSFQGLTDKCVHQLDPSTIAVVSQEQLHNLKPEAVHGLSDSQVSKIDDKVCSGFTAEQVAQFNSDYPCSVCAGFTDSCLANFSINSVRTMQESCMKKLQPNSLSLVTSEFIGALSDKVISAIQPEHMEHINASACEGFTGAQIAALGGSRACSSISPQCLAKMTTSAISQFAATCTARLRIDALGLVSADQVGAFSKDAIGSINSENIHLLGEACSGLALSQVSNMQSGCNGFTAQCFDHMRDSAVEGITGACMTRIEDKEVTGLHKSQFPHLSAESMQQMSTDKIGLLIKKYKLDFINALTPQQALAVESSKVQQMHRYFVEGYLERIRELKVDELGRVTWLQLAACTPSSIVAILNSHNIVNMSNDAFRGIGSVMNRLEKTILSEVSEAQLRSILPLAMFAVTKEQIGAIPTSIVQFMFPNINVDAIPGLTIEQVRKAFTSLTLSQVPCPLFEAFSANQGVAIQATNPTLYVVLNKRCKGVVPTVAPEPEPKTTKAVSKEPKTTKAVSKVPTVTQETTLAPARSAGHHSTSTVFALVISSLLVIFLL